MDNPFGTLRNSSQRMPPDSEVRSSIQSTTVMPASAATSSGEDFGFAVPGRVGFGRSARGRGGAGSFIRQIVNTAAMRRRWLPIMKRR